MALLHAETSATQSHHDATSGRDLVRGDSTHRCELRRQVLEVHAVRVLAVDVHRQLLAPNARRHGERDVRVVGGQHRGGVVRGARIDVTDHHLATGCGVGVTLEVLAAHAAADQRDGVATSSRAGRHIRVVDLGCSERKVVCSQATASNGGDGGLDAVDIDLHLPVGAGSLLHNASQLLQATREHPVLRRLARQRLRLTVSQGADQRYLRRCRRRDAKVVSLDEHLTTGGVDVRRHLLHHRRCVLEAPCLAWRCLGCVLSEHAVHSDVTEQGLGVGRLGVVGTGETGHVGFQRERRGAGKVGALTLRHAARH